MSKTCFDSIITNIQAIDISIMSKIEADLDLDDLQSLVFILYDDNDVAFERLLLLQSLNNEGGKTDHNMLHRWAVSVQQNNYWRYQLLEALSVIQTNDIIHKLGFNLKDVKDHYLPSNVYVSLHMHPIKKVLYKLCEQLDLKKLKELVTELKNRNIVLLDTKCCEVIIMQLIKLKFITLGTFENNSNNDVICDIKALADIVRLIDQKISDDLLFIQKHQNEKINQNKAKTHLNLLEKQLHYRKSSTSKLKSDEAFHSEIYTLRDPTNIGLCYIINQVEFSLPNVNTRTGSDKDAQKLKKTMEKIGFTVVIQRNVNSEELYVKLEQNLLRHTNNSMSVFILCILSHGEEGKIFCSDSETVSITSIQDFIDTYVSKPKVLIIQACQGDSPLKPGKLVPDSPCNALKKSFKPKKMDWLVFWATVPGHQAFRDEKYGSIFINHLCQLLLEQYEVEHLVDIFTKINNAVIYGSNKAMKDGSVQVSKFESTLTKKLFLKMPNSL